MKSAPARIVMIEDDEGHARLIEKHIRRAGVTSEISGFRDGASALAHFFHRRSGLARKADHPRIVLLDLNLPDMAGSDISPR